MSVEEAQASALQRNAPILRPDGQRQGQHHSAPGHGKMVPAGQRPARQCNEMYPSGDEVQTVEPWMPPDTWGDLSNDLLNRILTAIDAGLPDGNRYTDAPNVDTRAAWKVVQEHAPEKTEAQAREIIKTWVKNGVLEHYDYVNPTTRKR